MKLEADFNVLLALSLSPDCRLVNATGGGGRSVLGEALLRFAHAGGVLPISLSPGVCRWRGERFIDKGRVSVGRRMAGHISSLGILWLEIPFCGWKWL